MEQTNHWCYVYGYRRSGLGFQWTYIIKEIKNIFVFHLDLLVCAYGYHVSMVNVVFITKRPGREYSFDEFCTNHVTSQSSKSAEDYNPHSIQGR
jgi:hypothetical protein